MTTYQVPNLAGNTGSIQRACQATMIKQVII